MLKTHKKKMLKIKGNNSLMIKMHKIKWDVFVGAFLVGIEVGKKRDKTTAKLVEERMEGSVWCNMDISPLPRVMDFIDILVTKKKKNNNNNNYGAEAVVTSDQ